MASNGKVYFKKGLGPLTPKISISVAMLKSSVEKQQAPWLIDKGLKSLGVNFHEIATFLSYEITLPPGFLEENLRSSLGKAISEKIERIISSHNHQYSTHQIICDGVEKALADDSKLSLMELLEKMPADVEVDIDQIERLITFIESCSSEKDKQKIDHNEEGYSLSATDIVKVNFLYLGNPRIKKTDLEKLLGPIGINASITPFPKRRALADVLETVRQLESQEALAALIDCENFAQEYQLENKKTQIILQALAKAALKNSNKEGNILSSSFKATVRAVKFSPDGTYLAAGSDDRTLQIWKTYDEGKSYLQIFKFKAHKREVKAIEFSPDGQMIVSAGEDETVKCWNPQTGKLIHTFPRNHKHGIFSLAFRKDGLLASGSWDKCINLWDTHQLASQRTLQGHKSPVWTLAFSPDGQLLASGADDNTARLWNPDTGDLIDVLEGHKNGVYALAFSSDGQVLATGSWDQTICLWDMNNGKCLRTLKGHKAAVWQLRFTNDNQHLISSADDNLIHVWDLNTYTLRLTLSGHRNGVYGIDISPAQPLLASGSWDQTLRLWNLALGASD